jgi:hypothetical protein
LELKYKSYERNKKTEKEKKKSEPTGPIPAQPAQHHPPLGHGQPARASPTSPDFPFIFRFFRTYLHSNTYISRSTAPF